MVYEFVYDLCPEYQEKISQCLVLHSKDDDFNVALYSKLLCDNIRPTILNNFCVEKKNFFSSIPMTGRKLLIKTPRTSPWINSYECVMEQKSILEKRLQLNLEDIERRTADYAESILINY